MALRPRVGCLRRLHRPRISLLEKNSPFRTHRRRANLHTPRGRRAPPGPRTAPGRRRRRTNPPSTGSSTRCKTGTGRRAAGGRKTRLPATDGRHSPCLDRGRVRRVGGWVPGALGGTPRPRSNRRHLSTSSEKARGQGRVGLKPLRTSMVWTTDLLISRSSSNKLLHAPLPRSTAGSHTPSKTTDPLLPRRTDMGRHRLRPRIPPPARDMARGPTPRLARSSRNKRRRKRCRARGRTRHWRRKGRARRGRARACHLPLRRLVPTKERTRRRGRDRRGRPGRVPVRR